MSCVVCGGYNDGNHHCPTDLENRIEGGRKSWDDREPTAPSYDIRISVGFYLLQCAENNYD